MSKLFDEEEFLEDDSQVFMNENDEEIETSKELYRDKIFDNDYNTGNLDFEEFNLPKVDFLYADKNLEDCYDSYEYNRKINLEKIIDEYYKNTEHSKIAKKKIPKQTLPHLYISIREQFKNDDYVASEIFCAICEYFNMSYEILYQNIPAIYRSELIKEMDDKYGMLKKKGIKKLF